MLLDEVLIAAAIVTPFPGRLVAIPPVPPGDAAALLPALRLLLWIRAGACRGAEVPQEVLGAAPGLVER